MYLTQKDQLRNLTKSEYSTLRALCRLSKNLYNQSLYSVRQYYFAERRYLRYEGNYHLLKNSENYKLLNTDIAQQTIRVADRSFRSFFSLIKLAQKGKYRFEQISLPHYLLKDGYFVLIIPRFKVKDGYFKIPMSREFKKEHGEIKIPFPKRLKGKKIKEIRIHPRYDARYFEIEYVYLEDEQPADLDEDKVMSIDPGIDNLATCAVSTGASFIIDGKYLKSINQWYNKENARLQSIKDKQGIKSFTNQQSTLTNKRNHQVDDYLSKTARYIVNYCIDNRIGNLVLGYNSEWKQSANIGKRNTQNFVQIPHYKLKSKLQYLCEFYGINFKEQEESYTSKASFLDNDDLPIYNADNPQTYKFSGKRISRGQYRSTDGTVINADVNGAFNIIRKSNLVDLTVLQDRGCLTQPLRIRLG